MQKRALKAHWCRDDYSKTQCEYFPRKSFSRQGRGNSPNELHRNNADY